MELQNQQNWMRFPRVNSTVLGEKGCSQKKNMSQQNMIKKDTPRQQVDHLFSSNWSPKLLETVPRNRHACREIYSFAIWPLLLPKREWFRLVLEIILRQSSRRSRKIYFATGITMSLLGPFPTMWGIKWMRAGGPEAVVEGKWWWIGSNSSKKSYKWQ